MKKNLIVIFILTLLFSVNAQENNDLQNLNQLLETISAEQENFRVLELLQENSDEYIEKNEQIIKDEEDKLAKEAEENQLIQERLKQEAEKEKQRKRENSHIRGYYVGVNFPFASKEITSLRTPINSALPWGGSLGILTASNKWTIKLNTSFDILNIKDINKTVNFSSISLGRAPVHNYYFFLGYYFTLGAESINNYSLFNLGASGVMMFRFIGNVRFSLSIDATTRSYVNKEKKLPVSLEPLVDTWRVSPSVGLVFGY